MQALKATVRNGKLVLDETPTELPEGMDLELVAVEDEWMRRCLGAALVARPRHRTSP
jgi:hypothetical protein